MNTPGSFRCECLPGQNLDSSQRVCLDVRRGACWLSVTNGRCENNINRLTLKEECCSSIGKAWGSPCEICSLASKCRPGFALLNGIACTDLNECEIFPDLCKGGGVCINTEGSYECQCPPGLTKDPSGTRCLDHRESVCFLSYQYGRCAHPLFAAVRKPVCCCSIGSAWGEDCQTCPSRSSEEYNELCSRGIGFAPDPRGTFVKDINECTTYPELCSNGRCSNNQGSFVCTCNQGFALEEGGLNCTDIDECSIARGVCGEGTCENIPGSFRFPR